MDKLWINPLNLRSDVIFFADILARFFRNRTRFQLFFQHWVKLSCCISSSFLPLAPISGLKTEKKLKNLRSDNFCQIHTYISDKLCPISDFSKKSSGRRPISKNIRKTERKVDLRSVGALVRLLWRAAAPGLKPFRLLRAKHSTES